VFIVFIFMREEFARFIFYIKNMAGQDGVFAVSSGTFENNSDIPVKYCNKGVKGGQNISLPISWSNTPANTKSLLLLIADTHPIANNFLHWVVTNIPPLTTSIPEGASNTNHMPVGSIELNSTYGAKGYNGPQPPEGSGKHPYEVHLIALSNDQLDLSIQPSLDNIQEAISSITLNKSIYTGYFGR
jgi:Raf kinase inhibitor-like YbhB/YbcL family protein